MNKSVKLSNHWDKVSIRTQYSSQIQIFLKKFSIGLAVTNPEWLCEDYARLNLSVSDIHNKEGKSFGGQWNNKKFLVTHHVGPDTKTAHVSFRKLFFSTWPMTREAKFWEKSSLLTWLSFIISVSSKTNGLLMEKSVKVRPNKQDVG
mgnify:CR=1 FL=1